ncbi:MAG: glycosyltransferase family 1 protein, partial [Phototrophicales bacterium]
IDLVIAGGKGWLDNPIYTTIRESGLEHHIHMVGFVDDEDLPALYSTAELVAFPSLYEGFGFPVLEGMACGTPVLTSNVSSLPEVAGDAAIMVAPYDVEAIADGLIKILGDNKLRDELIAKGFEQAKRFTWEKAATHLKSIYTTKP